MLNDVVYGQSDVPEEIIAELITSAPMQRMKRVSQQGIPNEAMLQSIPFYSRFEHCVGVMLLLRRLGAPLDEQVAGLLHDVSHTAFSHVIDFVIGNSEKEDYQDTVHRSYLMGTELKGILESHGFDPERIAHLEAFPLLEREHPLLCADRVDYALKDLHYYYHYDSPAMAADLRNHDNEIVFASKKHAKTFGEGYMMCQMGIWGSDLRKAEYSILAEALKMGVDSGIITADDLQRRGDLEITTMLERAGDEEINKRLRALRSGIKFTVSEHGRILLRKKLRYVDPKYLEGGKPVPLSETDAGYKRLLEEEKKRVGERVYADVALD